MKRFFFRKKRKQAKIVLHSDRPASNPEYQFALKEYLSTVAPGSSNDNGRAYSYEENPQQLDEVPTMEGPMSMTESEATARRRQQEAMPILVETLKSEENDIESVLVQQHVQQHVRQEDMNAQQQQQYSPVPSSISHSIPFKQTQSIEEMYSQQQLSSEETGMKRRKVWVEPEMPDTTYEEQYGDAYVGAPIKYIYPSGYQSMRPRSGPWKLSIAICALFTWLSIFIVGHCSDRVQDQSQYYANEIDDDALTIETRWCGSRPLYFMWVASMLITGLAAAYCSVIGYIKVRDFAVANGRSQPPGMAGQTDYYVRIVDDAGSIAGSVTSASPYLGTIYQADGTPQFWGSHIYRPNQAAVAVTSR